MAIKHTARQALVLVAGVALLALTTPCTASSPDTRTISADLKLTFQDFFSGLSPASFFEDTYQKQLMVHHNGNGDATPTLQRVTQPLADVDKLCAVYEEYNLPEGFLKVGGGR